MKRISYVPYVFLLPFFLVILSLPPRLTERMRAFTVASFSPYWKGLDWMRCQVVGALNSVAPQPQAAAQDHLLVQSQLENVRAWLKQEEHLRKEYERYAQLGSLAAADDFFKRRAQELNQLLRLEAVALPALVCFRQPSSWSSRVWVNVGEQHNARLGRRVVAKNSAVIVGSCLVGVVEYVGQTQSRVRLITDATLTISVRAVRGGEQNRYLLDALEQLLIGLDAREELWNRQPHLKQELLVLKQQLEKRSSDLYLAKGELKGSGAPLWRSRDLLLSGVGFNYDFADQEGPARHLRSGQPYGMAASLAVRLLEKGDLLVTTGLDGIFPAGLSVGLVSSVVPLREGATAYDLKARPALPNFETLSQVFIIPPLG